MTVHAFDNKDRIPLRDLPLSDYLNICMAMRERPKFVEYYSDVFGQWRPADPALYLSSSYRVLPVIREAVIPWEHIAKEYRFAAPTAHSGYLLFTDRPELDEDGWWYAGRGSCLSATVFAGFVPSEGIAPEDSLRERPV